MSDNHKLVLFFKSGLSDTKFVQLLSIKHGSGFLNDERMLLKSIMLTATRRVLALSCKYPATF